MVNEVREFAPQAFAVVKALTPGSSALFLFPFPSQRFLPSVIKRSRVPCPKEWLSRLDGSTGKSGTPVPEAVTWCGCRGGFFRRWVFRCAQTLGLSGRGRVSPLAASSFSGHSYWRENEGVCQEQRGSETGASP